jgi:hypothetical protein
MARRKLAELQEHENKYFDLVWYERSLRRSDEEFVKLSQDTQDKIVAAQLRIEGAYPEEVEALRDHEEFIADPFQVGLNLGKLMAVRWAMGDEENNGDS